MKQRYIYSGMLCLSLSIFCHASSQDLRECSLTLSQDKTISLLAVLKNADVLCRGRRAGLLASPQSSSCNNAQDLILDAISACITMVERNLSIHDRVICSKIHDFDSKLDDVLAQECSKLLSFESIVDFVAVEFGIELSIHDINICSKLMLIESEVDTIATAVEDLSNTLVASTESFEDVLNAQNIESLIGDVKFVVDTIINVLKGA